MFIEKLYWASEPMTIGKHEWRAVVYGCKDYQRKMRRFTGFQWRPLNGRTVWPYPPQWWHDEDKWPRYDHNDGQFAGLPRTLVKLYEKHKPTIKAVYDGRAATDGPLFGGASNG